MSGRVGEYEQPAFHSRPSYRQKASVNKMRELIRGVLESELTGCTYQVDQATTQTKRICDEIKDALKEMNLARYKYVVQVVIGEQRGEGVRMGSRCFWDSETDNVASETYINVSTSGRGGGLIQLWKAGIVPVIGVLTRISTPFVPSGGRMRAFHQALKIVGVKVYGSPKSTRLDLICRYQSKI